MQVQTALALLIPRVELPGGIPLHGVWEHLLTTQGGLKSQIDADTKVKKLSKRTRVLTTVNDNELKVEYHFLKSTQTDHDKDNVILVDSSDEGDADQDESVDDKPDGLIQKQKTKMD